MRRFVILLGTQKPPSRSILLAFTTVLSSPDDKINIIMQRKLVTATSRKRSEIYSAKQPMKGANGSSLQTERIDGLVTPRTRFNVGPGPIRLVHWKEVQCPISSVTLKRNSAPPTYNAIKVERFGKDLTEQEHATSNVFVDFKEGTKRSIGRAGRFVKLIKENHVRFQRGFNDQLRC